MERQTKVTACKKKAGIGITNVQKRLELLYPGKHQLSITNDADVFVVNLKLVLERVNDHPATPVKSPEMAYA